MFWHDFPQMSRMVRWAIISCTLLTGSTHLKAIETENLKYHFKARVKCQVRSPVHGGCLDGNIVPARWYSMLVQHVDTSMRVWKCWGCTQESVCLYVGLGMLVRGVSAGALRSSIFVAFIRTFRFLKFKKFLGPEVHEMFGPLCWYLFSALQKKTCGALCSKAPLLLMKSGKSRKMKNRKTKKTLQKKMQAKADKNSQGATEQQLLRNV